MGRTNRQYYKFLKFGLVSHIKCRRHQFPTIKRNSHHKHRHCNKYTDQLSYSPFTYSKNNPKENTLAGSLRNGKYNLERYFQYEGEQEESMRAALQQEIKIRRKQNYDTKVGKNGLNMRDLLLMAWKMIKRRGSTAPFRGHRNVRQLHKREYYFSQ